MVYNEGLVGVWPLGGLESKCVVYKNIFDTPFFVCGGVFVKDAWLFYAVYICGVSRFPWFRQNQYSAISYHPLSSPSTSWTTFSDAGGATHRCFL